MPAPTCKNCPSFIGEAHVTEQNELYGKTTALASCSSLGKLLATEDMSSTQQDARFEEVAKSCANYGKPVTNRKVTLSVGFGAPPDPPARVATKSCRACHFMVPARETIKLVGVNMPLCTKFGYLVPEAKASAVGGKCSAGSRVNVVNMQEHIETLIDSFKVDPALAKYIMADADVASTYGTATVDIDPTLYPSDRPVTPQQSAQGIRAWRRITGPGGDVWLPIFDIDSFTPEEQAKIPRTGSDEHPEKYMDHMGLVYIIAVLWTQLDETPMLHGVAGTGKTELYRHLAWLMCLPFERISITRSTEIEDLAGKMHFEGNETVFKYGRIPKAWSKKCVILLDEPNVGNPEVWQFIRPLTDNSKQLVLDMNEGETISRNDFTFMGMAVNPSWDVRNVGAEQIGDADGSRLMHIFVGLPDAKIERKIILERCQLDGYELPEKKLDDIMKIAGAIRELSDDDTLAVTWGIRPQIKVARATRWFDMRRAYQLAVADYLEPAQKQTVLDIVETQLKGGTTR